MLIGISVGNLVSLVSNGGIICLLGESSSELFKSLKSYLSDEFEGSKKLVSATICESDLITDIVQHSTRFFLDAHKGRSRRDEAGNITFKPEKPSLLFIKKINMCMWDDPIIESLTDRRDTIKCVKVFATSYIETIIPDIRKRTNIWIITRDCSRGSIYTLFSSILKEYSFEEFMALLDEYRVLIIWRKERDYKLYSFSDVCPTKSLDTTEAIQSVMYPDIAKVILKYSYKVM